MAKQKFRLIKGSKLKPWQNPIQTGRIDFLKHLPDVEIDKAREEVVKQFQWAIQMRQPLYDDWQRYYRIYRGVDTDISNRPDWMSALFVRTALALVETIKPRTMSALFDTRPLFAAVPNRPGLDLQARLVEQRLEYINDATNMYSTVSDVESGRRIFGTSFIKTGYEYGAEYTGPCGRYRDVFDIYLDMTAQNIADMRWVFDREIMHIDKLKEMEAQGQVSGIDKVVESGEGSAFRSFNAIDRLKSIGKIGGTDESLMKDYHEVVEYWGKFKSETSEVFDIVMMVVDRKHVVQFKETPYYIHNKAEDYYYALKPIIKFVDIQVPKEPYGIGLIELIEENQAELNDTRNMMHDMKWYAMAPPMEVVESLLVNPEKKITFSPGEAIEVTGEGTANAVRPVQTSMNWQGGYQDCAEIQNDMRETTGVYKQMAGGEMNVRLTATQYSLMIKEAYERPKHAIRMMEKGGMATWAKYLYLLDRQFTDEDVQMRVYNADKTVGYATFNPSMTQFEGDFTLMCAALYGMKDLNAEKATAFIDLCQRIDAVTGKPSINYGVALKFVADNIGLTDQRLFEVQAAPAPAAIPQVGAAPAAPAAPQGMQAQIMGGMSGESPKTSQVRSDAQQMANQVA